MKYNHQSFDIVVIGSGAAGLGLALCLADKFNIAVLCKDNLQTSASQWAQGGIAAVMSKTDSLDSHINDTLIAGAGLCDPSVVKHTVENANHAIQQLIQYGIQFTTTENGSKKALHLTREGGHSHRRILHAQDRTGAAVVKTLLDQVKDHSNIHCFTEKTAIDLIIENNTCQGINVLDNQSQAIEVIQTNTVVLATGGASMTYLHTTNPSHTSGDGIGIAYRAGARIANMEFNQFHPTCLYNPTGDTILITEALRGEGAKLILADGTQFMSAYDKRKELAPRDIVARAIDSELKTKHLSNVFLDISFEDSNKVKSLFPNIYKKCLSLGIDITCSPIPVVPAAHYTCGGVVTNLKGETDIQGLYAIGEVACTGLHGANRMASNSLLECLVFANSAAATIRSTLTQFSTSKQLPTITQPNKQPNNHEITELQKTLRQLMWEHIGIVRSNQSIATGAEKLNQLNQQFSTLWKTHTKTKSLIELRNLLINAKLITLSAAHRKESRGTHFNSDYPQTMSSALNTIIKPQANDDEPVLESSDDISSLVIPS